MFVNGTSVAEGAELHEGGVLEEGVLILGEEVVKLKVVGGGYKSSTHPIDRPQGRTKDRG